MLASPCRYREIYAMYKKAVASFWTVEEVDLSQDQRDWDRLSGVAQDCHSMPDARLSFPSIAVEHQLHRRPALHTCNCRVCKPAPPCS